MKPSVVVEGARVFLGDCRDVLKTLPDNSVDSIVTDPPYELGFMGKSWDNSGIAYDVTVWEECLRVLKPGGHILAFGGTRTWHRLAVAIEDAGFQLRDSIAWLYSSGFPKSLDVSKAIDKMDAKGERLARSFRFTNWCKQHITARQIDDITDTKMGNHLTTHPTQPFVPTEDMFAMLRPYLPPVPEDIERLVFERTVESKNFAEREVIGQGTSGKTAIWNDDGEMGNFDLTAPATSEAQKWQGWGTALKPAFEPVVVGRKPLVGTVAENVLAWGVGGLNIDGSRIPSGDTIPQKFGKAVLGGTSEGWDRPCKNDPEWVRIRENRAKDAIDKANTMGRWPANVVLDEFTAGLLDEQSGNVKGQVGMSKTKGGFRFIEGDTEPGQTFVQGRADSGGASRFFYQAKASKRDRNEGLEDLGETQRGQKYGLTAGGTLPQQTPHKDEAVKNFHPTVKPTQLMRYLIKLVTPEGGTVLDPFTGSGSTGKAALLDGYEFIGAELTEEYLPIIEGRLRWAVENRDEETLF